MQNATVGPAFADRKKIWRIIEQVQQILTTIYGNVDDGNKDLVVSLIDYLTKLGFENYRHILENPPPVPSGQLPQPEITTP